MASRLGSLNVCALLIICGLAIDGFNLSVNVTGFLTNFRIHLGLRKLVKSVQVFILFILSQLRKEPSSVGIFKPLYFHHLESPAPDDFVDSADNCYRSLVFKELNHRSSLGYQS